MIWYLKVLRLFLEPSSCPCHHANLTSVQTSAMKIINWFNPNSFEENLRNKTNSEPTQNKNKKYILLE